MSLRIKELCSAIRPCKKLADVGCDHGLLTLTALNSAKCEKAFISDISEDCLKKAKELLADYIEDGKVNYAVCDGLEKVDKDCDSVIIAGMGGEEIVKILSESDFKPQNLYLQPMKNAEKVREYLINNGYGITLDYTFADGKYYDYIVAVKGKTSEYTADEMFFGRDNLKNMPKAFVDKTKGELGLYKKVFADCKTETAKSEILKKTERLERILNETR